MNLLDVNLLSLPLNQQIFIARYLREDSQQVVADKLGISQEYFSHLERGKSEISSKYHAEILRYLYKEGK